MALGKRTIQVDSATIKKAIADLDKLAPKKQPLREVVEQLKPSLVGALNKGYSYEELSNFLKDRGIFIAPGTIKQYLTAGGSKRKKEAEATSDQGDEELTTQEKSATEKSKVVLVEKEATPTLEDESQKNSTTALNSTEAAGTKKPSSKKTVVTASRAAANPKFVSISDEDL